jgi:hypothetical protein
MCPWSYEGEKRGEQRASAVVRRLRQAIVALCKLQVLDLSGNIINLESCEISELCAKNGGLAELQSLKLRAAQLDDTCALRLARMLAHLKGHSLAKAKAY